MDAGSGEAVGAGGEVADALDDDRSRDEQGEAPAALCIRRTMRSATHESDLASHGSEEKSLLDRAFYGWRKWAAPSDGNVESDGDWSPPAPKIGIFANVSSAFGDFLNNDLDNQVETWAAIAKDFAPFSFHDPRCVGDSIARYFDGTRRGITFLFNRVLNILDKDKADEETILTLCSYYYGFLGGVSYEQALERKGVRRFCDLVLRSRQRRDVLSRFDVCIRYLRIATLLLLPRPERWTVYIYDYDEANIAGSLVPSTTSRKRFREGRWLESVEVAEQLPAGSPGTGYDSVDTLFFSDPLTGRKGARWAHVVNPSMECALALGQQYRLPVHSQMLVSILNTAQPQAEVTVKGVEHEWSSIIFPAAYIERVSSESLDRYQAWYANFAAMVKAGSYKGDLRREMENMPVVRVGIIEVNMMLLWSRIDDNVLLSFSSEPKFVARWTSPSAGKSQGWLSCLLGCFCCCPQQRSGDPQGYKPLAGSEAEAAAAEEVDLEASEATYTMRFKEEEGLDDVDESVRMLKQVQLGTIAADNTRFEDTFQGVLHQLSEPCSLLRMGTHVQLLLRILLNRSANYLEIIQIYRIAISHCQEALQSDTYNNKQLVIDRVSAAKRELENLLRNVETFVTYVVPELKAVVGSGNSDDMAVRVCEHYKLDMINNFRFFLQECRIQVKLCASLMEEYNRNAADTMNNVLNFLAVVTFLIVPIQILTGLYGMNFEHMPELRWRYGYYFFFFAAAGATCLFAAILCCVSRPRRAK